MRITRPVLSSVVALALLVTAACSASDPSGSATASSATTSITVGAIPIVDVAPLHLGVTKGFFRQQRLDVKIAATTGGAAAVAGVVSGQFDFAFGNVVSLLLARSQGLPLKAVVEGNSSTGRAGKDFSGVVVPAGSPITSAAQLAGRRIAVNNLKNIGDTTVRASIRKAGGDPAKVTFIELPFPDMPAALAKKQVDAAWIVEPFLTIARDQGGSVIASNFVDAAPDLVVSLYFTKEQTVAKNPDLTRRFTTAIAQSLQYAQDHPDEARKALLGYTKITPEVAARITLPAWPQEINRASVSTVAALMRQDGTLTGDVDVADLLP